MPENSYHKIISQFRLLESQLNNSDKEKLRADMLSYLLFNEDLRIENNSGNLQAKFKELSGAEMELIRKLAAGTDLLHRLKNDGATDQ